MYTRVNPSFTIQKWGLRGSTLYRYVFMMNLFDNPLKKTKKYHDYKGWSLVTSLYSRDITFDFILVDF